MAVKQTVGMGDTEDEVVGRVAAEVAFLVAGMRPGQTLTVERFDDPAEMFRVRRTTEKPEAA